MALSVGAQGFPKRLPGNLAGPGSFFHENRLRCLFEAGFSFIAFQKGRSVRGIRSVVTSIVEGLGRPSSHGVAAALDGAAADLWGRTRRRSSMDGFMASSMGMEAKYAGPHPITTSPLHSNVEK